jgi:hypothetical protein
MTVIENLRKRMGISLETPGSTSTATSTSRNVRGPTSEVTPTSQYNTFTPDSNASSTSRSHLQDDTIINHEPTMIARQFVPDLDVDTIIYSFMNEQRQQLYGQPA